MKPISPQLGFNNNVRHKGRVFHIQTEDSGIKRPHIITHLFADGGRILKSTKTSYAEFLDDAELAKRIRSMMQEQHKAMFIALRGGKFDHMFDGVPLEAAAEGKPAEAAPAPADAPAAPAPAAAPSAPAAPDPGPHSGAEAERFARGSLPSSTGASLPPMPPLPASQPDPGHEPPAPAAAASPSVPPAPRPSVPPAAEAAPRSLSLRAPSMPPPKPAAPAPGPPSSPLGPKPPSRPSSRLEALARDAEPRAPSSPARPPARPPLSASLDLDLEALERAAEQGQKPGYHQVRDLPPPPTALRRAPLANTSYRSVTPQATQVTQPPPSGNKPVTPPRGAPPAGAPRPPASQPGSSRYAPSRPASIFGQSRPQEGSSIFGEDLISEKSLDEVILSYLAEDLEGTAKK